MQLEIQHRILDGSNREGDNLYANSVVAVNAENGDYVWHFQQVHHDIWDMDPANPVILYDVEMDGKMRKGLGQAGKTGWIYFLDRTDGTPLVGIEEKPVPQDGRAENSGNTTVSDWRFIRSSSCDGRRREKRFII